MDCIHFKWGIGYSSISEEGHIHTKQNSEIGYESVSLDYG